MDRFKAQKSHIKSTHYTNHATFNQLCFKKVFIQKLPFFNTNLTKIPIPFPQIPTTFSNYQDKYNVPNINTSTIYSMPIAIQFLLIPAPFQQYYIFSNTNSLSFFQYYQPIPILQGFSIPPHSPSWAKKCFLTVSVLKSITEIVPSIEPVMA